MFKSRKRLGDLLVESGKLTKDQLKEILALQRGTKKKFGELIIDNNLLSEDEIIEVLKIQLKLDRVYLETENIDLDAIKLVPERIAKKYVVFPYKIEGNTMKVAMIDPLNLFAIDDLKITSGKEIVPVISRRDEIERTIDKCYSKRNVEKVAEELNKEVRDRKITLTDEEVSLEEIKNAPAVKLIDSIFANAIKSKASDIHIEVFDSHVKVRYRIDGVLNEVIRMPKESQAALIARIKIMANMDIAEKRIPQDGRIMTDMGNEKIDLRVSILPTIHGEKAVIRILKKDKNLVNKNNLGFNKKQIERIEKMIKSPFGIVLVTGPTGSGKTTTLYAVLNELNNSDKNIVTIEDPVEYEMEGINQVNINTKAGLTFNAGLRSILRQDPDIVMIGEIRDGDTAQIATRAAITGHFVLSTIHTNDAASAVIRLVDMGVESYIVSTALSGIIAQRLVRKLCPHCKEKFIPTKAQREMVGRTNDDHIEFYNAIGCSKCGNTGYKGRIGLFEVMEITNKHRDLIQEGKSTEDLRRLNDEQGITSLKGQALEYLISGEITLGEYAKVAFLE
ncbi:GspE/PulE family protein [Oceanirhabdus seepicola]|uniref:Flp pilus assembly complex ATPase component TadA n=1 Tax=Oceanirhabdus seepicola TaxID=2828781 RepID=A0A9J6P4X5_9CLOT|nr:GspE/PulE family protein [Oceanirhabdus seepicola]MCM1990837.1 Flp pilus assembly complex ATPase component TadA [Oceanirhabdus seepicola]